MFSENFSSLSSIVDTMRTAHLVFVSMWAGLVAAEIVIELYVSRTRMYRDALVEFHFWIDLLVELPLIAGVIMTGIGNLFYLHTVTSLHWVKFGLAAVALSANLWCVLNVVRRRQERMSGLSFFGNLDGKIILAGVVGIPTGIATAVLGVILAATHLHAGF